MSAFPWLCPFCDRHVTITNDHISTVRHHFELGSKHKYQSVYTTVISCPNPDCREYALTATLHDHRLVGAEWKDLEPRRTWKLIPHGAARAFPDYISSAILADYREACLIREDSPKASATLSRRCMQGMIRDFWGVSKPRLKDEIDAIKDKVDAATWEAIDSVRRLGNIGAHMELDIDVIVDVDPPEASLMIELIETLLTEWYIARHERQVRMASLTKAAKQKRAVATP